MKNDKELERARKYAWLWFHQDAYRDYGVKNVWGFGNKMRDYLFEGRRRIPFKW